MARYLVSYVSHSLAVAAPHNSPESQSISLSQSTSTSLELLLLSNSHLPQTTPIVPLNFPLNFPLIMSSIASSSRLVLSFGHPFRAPVTAAPGIKLVRAQAVAPGIKLVRRSIHSKAPASSMAAASSEASRVCPFPEGENESRYADTQRLIRPVSLRLQSASLPVSPLLPNTSSHVLARLTPHARPPFPIAFPLPSSDHSLPLIVIRARAPVRLQP